MCKFKLNISYRIIYLHYHDEYLSYSDYDDAAEYHLYYKCYHRYCYSVHQSSFIIF